MLSKLVCFLLIIIVFTSLGCLSSHGFNEGDEVKTTLEYNQRTNSSFSGVVVLIENTADSSNSYIRPPNHYILTVYNKHLGSKQKFDEMDLIPVEG